MPTPFLAADLIDTLLYVVISVAVLIIAGGFFTVLTCFRKVDQGQALVRNGVGGTKVSFSGMVVFPAKLTRDSLGDLPFVGATLRFVMGVWSMFRVVRIGARGVRWAFPEDRARRRRR